MYPGVRIREVQLLTCSLGGDRMGNLGQGLHNIDWQNQSLAKFEKKSVFLFFFHCSSILLESLQ